MPYGPPIPGAPWTRERRDPFAAPPAPVAQARAFDGGPPSPGFPWGTRYAPPVPLRQPPGTRPPAPPAGPTVASKPFLARMRDEKDLTRARRALDVLSNMVNSLVASGQLVMTGTNTFAIRGAAIPATRAPTNNDDISQGVLVGTTWVNTAAQTFYVCVSNTQGAAVWQQK